MGVQIHMRHGNGEYNNSYARVENFVNDKDVVIHAKGSCDPHMKKDEEIVESDYNLAINKPKINGRTLIGDMTDEELGIKGNVNAYGEKHKVKDYLYEIYYNTLDYDYALDYFNKVRVSIPMGACSAVRKGDFYGRNFDWIYDESATFIVRIPRIGNRYASMGISGSEHRLTNDTANINDYNEAYKILPFKIVDGINEYGVVVNSNVVPNDKGINTETIPAVEKRETICNLMLVRYILDNFQTAQSAVNYIRDYVAVYPVKALEDMHYELHVMVADANNTYVIEIVNNEVIIKDVTEKPYMTNFYLDGVTFNGDGKTYYPAINDAEHNPKITNGVTDNGSGLERYAKIVDAYDGLNDMASIIDFMSQELKYSKAYIGGDPEGIGEWYTEFVGNGVTVASNPEDFTEVLAKSKNAFEHRSRDPQSKYYGTWQTTHTSVYDMRNKKVNVIVQEDGEALEYTFNALNGNGGTIETPWEKGMGIDSAQLKNTGAMAKSLYSVAEGELSEVTQSDNFVERYNDGRGAHAEGGRTTAMGSYSHTEGNNTITNNPYEHAEGHFNISNCTRTTYPDAGNTIHSIGIGSNLSNRKNAVEVMQNGDAYIIGVGNYDGTNYNEANTLQDVVNAKADTSYVDAKIAEAIEELLKRIGG